MQARGKGLPRTYEAALTLLNRARKRSLGRILGNYRVAVSEHDRNEDEERPVMGVSYHATEVATFYPDGRVEFTMGGWDTVSTHNVIGAVLGHHYDVLLGSSIAKLGTCWYVKHAPLHPEDRGYLDWYPVSTRQRYMLDPNQPRTPLVRSWSAEEGTRWVPLDAVLHVSPARPLPRHRNTLSEPKVGDAFFDQKLGNAYIWATQRLQGGKGEPRFAVPYRSEYANRTSVVVIYPRQPLHPVSLMGNDFDPLILSKHVDAWVPIDRTKGGVYARQD